MAKHPNKHIQAALEYAEQCELNQENLPMLFVGYVAF